jgi:hypothetical protein
MKEPGILKGTADVSAQVFEKFFQALETSDVSSEITSRLRKTLLENQVFTDSALKEAVLGRESTL